MEENFRFKYAFRDCVSLKAIELPKIEPLPFKHVWNTVVIPKILGTKLPNINHKPRKTTYKTVKRFSAKRNRK